MRGAVRIEPHLGRDVQNARQRLALGLAEPNPAPLHGRGRQMNLALLVGALLFLVGWLLFLVGAVVFLLRVRTLPASDDRKSYREHD
ncbi:MAG: hypothetical protein IT375_22080 [Polyangiaceae bacterium]|nr:hypothetical protein [Polyangiaceae bacterium]